MPLIKGPNKCEHRPDGTTVLFLERKDGTEMQCVIDTADYDLVKLYRWHAQKHRKTFYARADVPNPEGRHTRALHMHQLVLLPTLDKTPDHINHNGLDNRRGNLRLATALEQAHNQTARIDGSGCKGVSLRKDNGLWRARITVDYKRMTLGHFASREEAQKVYDAAAKKYYGSFGFLNSQAA